MSVSKAQKLLSLYSIEKIENFAKIDIGRKFRSGIPEVIFAENKKLEEIKKIIPKVLKKTDSLLISRINEKDYKKLLDFTNKNKFKSKTNPLPGVSNISIPAFWRISFVLGECGLVKAIIFEKHSDSC